MTACILGASVGIMAFAFFMTMPESNTVDLIAAIASLVFAGAMEVIALEKEDKIKSKIAELEEKVNAKEV